MSPLKAVLTRDMHFFASRYWCWAEFWRSWRVLAWLCGCMSSDVLQTAGAGLELWSQHHREPNSPYLTTD